MLFWGERVRGEMKATQPINSPLTTFATNYFSSADDSQIQDESAGEAAYRRLCQCDKPLAVCVLSVFLTVGSWQVMLGFFMLGAQCRPTVSCFHFQISHLNSEVQRRKLIQRKKNSCVVFSSSQCFARSVCSDQEALMGEFWVQARQAGSADAGQEVNSSVLYCHTSSCSYRKSQFIQSSLTVI